MPNEHIGRCPVYFATRALNARRIKLQPGDPFPLQDKTSIRGLGRSYGVPDAMDCSFASLPYVEVINVGSAEMARHIREQGMGAKHVRTLMRRHIVFYAGQKRVRMLRACCIESRT